MNEILRHFVHQNDIDQEPVIASEAKQSPLYLAVKLKSFGFAPDKTGDFAPLSLRSGTTPHKYRGALQDRRRPTGLLAMTR